MAQIKAIYYRLNDTRNAWDEIHFKTTADLIQETTGLKVLTSAERDLITDYLNTFNAANKLVKLDSDAKVPTNNIPALDYIPTTGGDVSGDINFESTGTGITFPKYNQLIPSLTVNSLGVMGFNSQKYHFKQDNTNILEMSSVAIDFFDKPLRNVQDPTQPKDAVNRQWVEQLVAQGTHVVGAVRAASTGPITSLSGAPKTIDGVELVEGDRVLIKDQTTASQNGVYIVETGGWTKLDNDSDKGSLVFVTDGLTNKATQYYYNGTEWGLFFSQVKYSAKTNGGLKLDGLEFSIENGGVTNAMLAGNILETKLDPFEVIPEKPENDWVSIRTTIHGAASPLRNKIYGLSSAIAKLRGRSSLDDASTQTVKGAYELAETKTKIYLGSGLPQLPSFHNAGDIYLLDITP